MLQSLRKNKVVKNAGWIIGGKVANKLLAFVVGIFAARYLGPSNYGLINYAAAYATFFASLCTLGINSVIVKNFVDHPDQQGETIGTTLLLRAMSSLLSALAIIGIVSVVDRGERLTVVVVALYSIGLIFQVFDTLNYWFQARLQSKYSAIAELVSYAAMSVYKIILLALGKSVEWFAVASALDYIVLAAFLLIAYFKNGGTRFHYSLKKAKELLQSSNSFIIAGLMVSIYACTDKLMLTNLQTIRNRRMLWSPDIVALNKRISDLTSQNQTLAFLKQQGLVDPDIFIAKTNELTKQLRQAKQEKEKLMDAESDMTALQTRDLIDLLKGGPEFLDSFDAELFGELVEKIIIEGNDSVRFCLKNGLELQESIERTVR